MEKEQKAFKGTEGKRNRDGTPKDSNAPRDGMAISDNGDHHHDEEMKPNDPKRFKGKDSNNQFTFDDYYIEGRGDVLFPSKDDKPVAVNYRELWLTWNIPKEGTIVALKAMNPYIYWPLDIMNALGLEFGSRLGGGAFGDVYEARLHGLPVAVKVGEVGPPEYEFNKARRMGELGFGPKVYQWLRVPALTYKTLFLPVAKDTKSVINVEFKSYMYGGWKSNTTYQFMFIMERLYSSVEDWINPKWKPKSIGDPEPSRLRQLTTLDAFALNELVEQFFGMGFYIIDFHLGNTMVQPRNPQDPWQVNRFYIIDFGGSDKLSLWEGPSKPESFLGENAKKFIKSYQNYLNVNIQCLLCDHGSLPVHVAEFMMAWQLIALRHASQALKLQGLQLVQQDFPVWDFKPTLTEVDKDEILKEVEERLRGKAPSAAAATAFKGTEVKPREPKRRRRKGERVVLEDGNELVEIKTSMKERKTLVKNRWQLFKLQRDVSHIIMVINAKVVDWHREFRFTFDREFDFFKTDLTGTLQLSLVKKAPPPCF